MNYIAKCGCSVEVIDEVNGTAIILHCPKHEAADDMYEACRQTWLYFLRRPAKTEEMHNLLTIIGNATAGAEGK